eukprot:COSAG05_NODE_3151_length_2284_cov_2.301144_1_plen_134_part_00
MPLTDLVARASRQLRAGDEDCAATRRFLSMRAHFCCICRQTSVVHGFSDYVVTEAGFGADLGAEKFFDIKCRKAGLTPAAAVVVCSVRALRAHSADGDALLHGGMANLERHLENIGKFGVPAVVALNVFADDR